MASRDPKQKKRWVILEEYAKAECWTRLAEIGVHKGTTFGWLLRTCPDLTVIGVDIWDEYFNWGAKRERTVPEAEALENYRRVLGVAKPYGARAIILKGRSTDPKILAQVSDGSLDCVFIDANHTYEDVYAEIMAWRPKIRAGGMLSGHDARIAGVRKAIDALAPGWKQMDNDVWAVRV